MLAPVSFMFHASHAWNATSYSFFYAIFIMEERKVIYLCLAHMSEEGVEQKYVKEAFDTNWVVPMGPNVNAFEQDLARMAT